MADPRAALGKEDLATGNSFLTGELGISSVAAVTHRTPMPALPHSHKKASQTKAAFIKSIPPLLLEEQTCTHAPRVERAAPAQGSGGQSTLEHWHCMEQGSHLRPTALHSRAQGKQRRFTVTGYKTLCSKTLHQMRHLLLPPFLLRPAFPPGLKRRVSTTQGKCGVSRK